MSSIHRSGRYNIADRSHLVLVRGGLDARQADPRGADWQAFCERIGWQCRDEAPADDFEDRLAERIFARRELLDVVTFDVVTFDDVSFDVEREPRGQRSAGADWTSDFEGGRRRSALSPRRPSARAIAMGSTVAALLCVAAAAVLFWSGRPSASAAARPDPEAAQRAAVLPEVERPLPVDSAQVPPVPLPERSSFRDKDSPPNAPPREMAPHRAKPKTPGSLIAERAPLDANRARMSSRPNRAAAGTEPVAAVAHGWMRSTSHGDSPSVARTSFEVSVAPPPGLHSVRDAIAPIPRAWDEPHTSATSLASFVPPGSAVAGASWTLSSASQRFYGVGLPPAAGAQGVPALGVIAQLDLGKAFKL